MAVSEIRSPLPGTFYRKPAPEQPPYKNEGEPIAVGDVVGLVEVMKSFHEIKSDVSGTFLRFLAEHEEAITPGQVIAEVDSSAS